MVIGSPLSFKKSCQTYTEPQQVSAKAVKKGAPPDKSFYFFHSYLKRFRIDWMSSEGAMIFPFASI